MFSVTQRIKQITQPKNGYLPVKSFKKYYLDDGMILHNEENISPSLVGTAVDYLVRFMIGESSTSAFHISLLGAKKIGMEIKANKLLSKIRGIDSVSITAACKLVGFDVCFRAGMHLYKSIEFINPNVETIENIRIMVERSLHFFQIYGMPLKTEITFEGGYSEIVAYGDGDFITEDTLWDFKVSKKHITNLHTLQLLMYYIMGTHSIHPWFKNITRLGAYNPRLNVVYLCDTASISTDTIQDIEKNVICYELELSDFLMGNKNKRKIESIRNVTLTKNFFVASEVCQITGQEKAEVYNDIRRGILTATKKGTRYYITKFYLEQYISYLNKKYHG